MGAPLSHLNVAVRKLAATPAFSAAAVLTLSLTIGGLTAAFAVADRLLLDPLPYAEADRLVDVGYGVPGYGFDVLPFSIGTFHHTRQEQRALSDVAVYYDADRYNVGLDDPERVPVARVSAGFFGVFRSPPAQGRAFLEADERPGATPVAIVSHDLWRRRFGADPGLVGRPIHVEGVEREVVGIARAGFRFPDRRTGLWVPLTIDPADLAPMTFGYVGVGRLAPGLSLASAREDLARVTGQLTDVFPGRLTRRWAEDGRFHSYVRPLKQRVVGDVRAEVWLVVGTAALLLLLAAANLGGLFLVRLEGRAREFAIRRALGSSPSGLVAVPLVESLVVAGAGAAGGTGLAAALLSSLVRVAPPDLPRIGEIALDRGAVTVAVAAALGVGAFLTALSALAARGGSFHAALRAGGVASTVRRGTRGFQGALLASQAALAVALVAGAGLLATSARKLAAVDPGFRFESVLSFEIGLPAGEYDADARARTWREIAERIGQVASVTSAGGGEFLPLGVDFKKGPLHVEGEELPEGQAGPIVDVNRVTPGYFAALGIPLLEGRLLDRDDGPGGRPSVVVNQALVDRHLGDGPALGRRIRITRNMEYQEIVGVVGSVRSESFREEPLPFVYLPPGSVTPSSPDVPAAMSFVVSSQAPPERLVPLLAETVGRIDPKLPLGSVRTLDAVVEDHLARQDFVAWLLVGMASVGVLLAAVGVYSVVAYVVARRREEIGVRIALGAGASDVLVRSARSGLAAVGVGAVAGAALAFAGVRLVESLLFGVSGADPLAYGSAVLLVLAAAALASLPPAWRAARMNPNAVLRQG